MNQKVKVYSTVNHRVGVEVKDLRFSRQWPAKGAAVSIDREVLEELMYDQGFRYMIESGMLYIEDLQVKKELGLEPEDVTEPVNIIVLSDKDKQHYWNDLNLVGFKDKLKSLSIEQVNDLIDYAIKNRIVNIDKCKFIKETTGRDIISTIQLSEQDKED